MRVRRFTESLETLPKIKTRTAGNSFQGETSTPNSGTLNPDDASFRAWWLWLPRDPEESCAFIGAFIVRVRLTVGGDDAKATAASSRPQSLSTSPRRAPANRGANVFAILPKKNWRFGKEGLEFIYLCDDPSSMDEFYFVDNQHLSCLLNTRPRGTRLRGYAVYGLYSTSSCGLGAYEYRTSTRTVRVSVCF